jgi:hypothetical protein
MEVLLVFQFKDIESVDGPKAKAKEEEMKAACATWTAEYETPVRLQESFGEECLHILIIFQYPHTTSPEGEEADEIIAAIHEEMGEWIRERRFDTQDIWIEDVFSDASEEDDSPA